MIASLLPCGRRGKHLPWYAVPFAVVVVAGAAACFAADEAKPIELPDAVVQATVKGPAEFSLTGPEQIKTTETATLSATGLPDVDWDKPLAESLKWTRDLKFLVIGPPNAKPTLKVSLAVLLFPPSVELVITFSADKPGTYDVIGDWNAAPFGLAYHRITVVAPGPPPVGQLKAEPTEIYKGGSSQLVWSATNADSAKDESGRDVPVSGQATVSPAETTTYMRTWEGPGGATQASAQVTVAPFPPPAATLSVTPEEIQLGQSALWTWGTANTSAQLLDNKPVPEEGSEETTPTTAGSVTRKLVVTGLDGKQRPPVMATLKVKPNPNPAPIPVAGLHVLMVLDRQVSLPPAQQSIPTSDILRAYVRAAKGELKVISPGSDLSKMDGKWGTAVTKYRDKLTAPAWIVSNNPHGGEVGPLPATVDAAGAVLAKWTPSAPFIRGPPAKAVKLYEITDADVGDGKIVFIDGHARPLGSFPKPDDRAAPEGVLSFAEAKIALIPESEWAPRLAQLKKDRARLQDMLEGAGIKANDQNGYGLCWCFAACGSHQICSFFEGNSNSLVSVASVAGQIYSNFGVNGGWPGEAVEYLANKGGIHESLWPMLGLSNSKYSTPAGEADRVNHKNVVYVQLSTSNMWNEYVSCVLQGIPVCVTYDWWNHAVTGVGIEGDAAVIWNSWGSSYGTNGFGQITGSRRVPSEAYAVLEVTHSECRAPTTKPAPKPTAKIIAPPPLDEPPATTVTPTTNTYYYWSPNGYYVPQSAANRNGPSYAPLPGG